MSHDIKKLLPKRDSKYKQGYVNPDSCKKLFEDMRLKPVIYRSSYEKTFIEWCEKCKDVLHWGSECAGIPYINAYDGQQHTYYPDFFLEMTDGSKVIVEIKPYSQTQKPKVLNDYNMKQYITNMSKWKFVKEMCSAHDWKFWIITEKSLNKLKY